MINWASFITKFLIEKAPPWPIFWAYILNFGTVAGSGHLANRKGSKLVSIGFYCININFLCDGAKRLYFGTLTELVSSS
jgi:hypothetical protein